MARIMGVNVIGVFLTLLVTAQIAISVRNLVRTQLEETTPPKQSFPFNRNHYVGWGEALRSSVQSSITFAAMPVSGCSLHCNVPSMGRLKNKHAGPINRAISLVKPLW